MNSSNPVDWSQLTNGNNSSFSPVQHQDSIGQPFSFNQFSSSSSSHLGRRVQMNDEPDDNRDAQIEILMSTVRVLKGQLDRARGSADGPDPDPDSQDSARFDSLITALDNGPSRLSSSRLENPQMGNRLSVPGPDDAAIRFHGLKIGASNLEGDIPPEKLRRARQHLVAKEIRQTWNIACNMVYHNIDDWKAFAGKKINPFIAREMEEEVKDMKDEDDRRRWTATIEADMGDFIYTNDYDVLMDNKAVTESVKDPSQGRVNAFKLLAPWLLFAVQMHTGQQNHDEAWIRGIMASTSIAQMNHLLYQYMFNHKDELVYTLKTLGQSSFGNDAVVDDTCAQFGAEIGFRSLCTLSMDTLDVMEREANQSSPETILEFDVRVIMPFLVLVMASFKRTMWTVPLDQSERILDMIIELQHATQGDEVEYDSDKRPLIPSRLGEELIAPMQTGKRTLVSKTKAPARGQIAPSQTPKRNALHETGAPVRGQSSMLRMRQADSFARQRYCELFLARQIKREKHMRSELKKACLMKNPVVPSTEHADDSTEYSGQDSDQIASELISKYKSTVTRISPVSKNLTNTCSAMMRRLNLVSQTPLAFIPFVSLDPASVEVGQQGISNIASAPNSSAMMADDGKSLMVQGREPTLYESAAIANAIVTYAVGQLEDASKDAAKALEMAGRLDRDMFVSDADLSSSWGAGSSTGIPVINNSLSFGPASLGGASSLPSASASPSSAPAVVAPVMGLQAARQTGNAVLRVQGMLERLKTLLERSTKQMGDAVESDVWPDFKTTSRLFMDNGKDLSMENITLSDQISAITQTCIAVCRFAAQQTLTISLLGNMVYGLESGLQQIALAFRMCSSADSRGLDTDRRAFQRQLIESLTEQILSPSAQNMQYRQLVGVRVANAVFEDFKDTFSSSSIPVERLIKQQQELLAKSINHLIDESRNYRHGLSSSTALGSSSSSSTAASQMNTGSQPMEYTGKSAEGPGDAIIRLLPTLGVTWAIGTSGHVRASRALLSQIELQSRVAQDIVSSSSSSNVQNPFDIKLAGKGVVDLVRDKGVMAILSQPLVTAYAAESRVIELTNSAITLTHGAMDIAWEQMQVSRRLVEVVQAQGAIINAKQERETRTTAALRQLSLAVGMQSTLGASIEQLHAGSSGETPAVTQFTKEIAKTSVEVAEKIKQFAAQGWRTAVDQVGAVQDMGRYKDIPFPLSKNVVDEFQGKIDRFAEDIRMAQRVEAEYRLIKANEVLGIGLGQATSLLMGELLHGILLTLQMITNPDVFMTESAPSSSAAHTNSGRRNIILQVPANAMYMPAGMKAIWTDIDQRLARKFSHWESLLGVIDPLFRNPASPERASLPSQSFQYLVRELEKLVTKTVAETTFNELKVAIEAEASGGKSKSALKEAAGDPSDAINSKIGAVMKAVTRGVWREIAAVQQNYIDEMSMSPIEMRRVKEKLVMSTVVTARLLRLKELSQKEISVSKSFPELVDVLFKTVHDGQKFFSKTVRDLEDKAKRKADKKKDEDALINIVGWLPDPTVKTQFEKFAGGFLRALAWSGRPDEGFRTGDDAEYAILMNSRFNAVVRVLRVASAAGAPLRIHQDIPFSMLTSTPHKAAQYARDGAMTLILNHSPAPGDEKQMERKDDDQEDSSDHDDSSMTENRSVYSSEVRKRRMHRAVATTTVRFRMASRARIELLDESVKEMGDEEELVVVSASLPPSPRSSSGLSFDMLENKYEAAEDGGKGFQMASMTRSLEEIEKEPTSRFINNGRIVDPTRIEVQNTANPPDPDVPIDVSQMQEALRDVPTQARKRGTKPVSEHVVYSQKNLQATLDEVERVRSQLELLVPQVTAQSAADVDDPWDYVSLDEGLSQLSGAGSDRPSFRSLRTTNIKTFINMLDSLHAAVRQKIDTGNSDDIERLSVQTYDPALRDGSEEDKKMWEIVRTGLEVSAGSSLGANVIQRFYLFEIAEYLHENYTQLMKDMTTVYQAFVKRWSAFTGDQVSLRTLRMLEDDKDHKQVDDEMMNLQSMLARVMPPMLPTPSESTDANSSPMSSEEAAELIRGTLCAMADLNRYYELLLTDVGVAAVSAAVGYIRTLKSGQFTDVTVADCLTSPDISDRFGWLVGRYAFVISYGSIKWVAAKKGTTPQDMAAAVNLSKEHITSLGDAINKEFKRNSSVNRNRSSDELGVLHYSQESYFVRADTSGMQTIKQTALRERRDWASMLEALTGESD